MSNHVRPGWNTVRTLIDQHGTKSISWPFKDLNSHHTVQFTDDSPAFFVGVYTDNRYASVPEPSVAVFAKKPKGSRGLRMLKQEEISKLRGAQFCAILGSDNTLALAKVGRDAVHIFLEKHGPIKKFEPLVTSTRKVRCSPL